MKKNFIEEVHNKVLVIRRKMRVGTAKIYRQKVWLGHFNKYPLFNLAPKGQK